MLVCVCIYIQMYSCHCCDKIQFSRTQLHLVVNLLDCFMAQRQIASQPRTGSRYCSLRVHRGWASNTRKSSQCLFVSLWRMILPSYIGENWTERSILTLLDGLRAWYRMCDQLKHTAVLSPICLRQLCIIDCCIVWMWCVILTMNHWASRLFSSAKLLSDLSSSISRFFCECVCVCWSLNLDNYTTEHEFRQTVFTGNVAVLQLFKREITQFPSLQMKN